MQKVELKQMFHWNFANHSLKDLYSRL